MSALKFIITTVNEILFCILYNITEIGMDIKR